MSREEMEEYERQNPIFAKYPPESIEYKTELFNLLSHTAPDHLVFFVDRYEMRERKEYLYLHVKGDDFLGTMIMTIENWKNLESIRDHKAFGYSGTAILDLNYVAKQTPRDIEFIYHSCKGIVD
jgi:hypothetical protein